MLANLSYFELIQKTKMTTQSFNPQEKKAIKGLSNSSPYQSLFNGMKACQSSLERLGDKIDSKANELLKELNIRIEQAKHYLS